MEVGVSYKRTPIKGTYDAIVIGSGIGGLTTAAILAKHAKKRVLVLERHYTAGGYTHSFTRPGYEWDVGVHYVGQVGDRGRLKPIYDYLTDGKLAWASVGWPGQAGVVTGINAQGIAVMVDPARTSDVRATRTARPVALLARRRAKRAATA